MNIQNSLIAQNYNLALKPDSTSNYLDETKIRKTFNSKIQITNYLDSISNAFSLNGFFNNYYELKYANSKATASFKLNSKIDTIQINLKNKQIDLSRVSSYIKILNSNYIEFSTKHTNTILGEISNFYEQLGYSFVQASLTNLVLKNSKIQAELAIRTSHKRHIDDVIVKGYSEISVKHLKRILQLDNKKVFNKELLANIEKIITSINFIEQIKQPEVLFAKDSTFLYLYLKKKSNNHMNGIIGFSTNSNNKVILNGDLDLNLANVFNSGENFNLNWKSYNNNSSLHTLLNLPAILTPYISFKGDFNLTKQDTIYTTSQGKLNIIYNINKNHSIGGIINFEKSNLTNTKITEVLGNYKKSELGLSYMFSFLSSKSNTPFSASISYLKGKKNNFEETESLNLFIENTFKLNYKNSIYLKLTAQQLRSSKLFENELLKIGGYNSLRGFNELSIYTSEYALANIEYQYHLNKKNFLYTITDFAITNNTVNLEKKSLLGLGVGYYFTTNNSILNFSYVVGKNSRLPFNLNNSRMHLKITYPF